MYQSLARRSTCGQSPGVARRSRDAGHRFRTTAALLFFNQVMLIGERGNLRQVGDAEHLLASRQGLQFLSDSLRCAAANANIDFIEHQRARQLRFLLPFRGGRWHSLPR